MSFYAHREVKGSEEEGFHGGFKGFIIERREKDGMKQEFKL